MNAADRTERQYIRWKLDMSDELDVLVPLGDITISGDRGEFGESQTPLDGYFEARVRKDSCTEDQRKIARAFVDMIASSSSRAHPRPDGRIEPQTVPGSPRIIAKRGTSNLLDEASERDAE